MSEVLILGEVNDGLPTPRTLELASAGKKLGKGGGYAILFMGDSVAGPAEAAALYGPKRVYRVAHPLLKGYTPDLWLSALEQACQQIQPAILLLSHGFVGMELGPRLACRLNTRLTTDCIDLAVDDDGLLLRTKPVAGGNAISVQKCPGMPQLATVRGKVFPPAERGGDPAEQVDLEVDLDPSLVKVESIERVREDIVSLDKADVVVAGGAGLGEAGGFELLEDLAAVLRKSFNNVMIGCSRVAVDKGWISSDHQVGLTGTMISPDIYVAVGISGAIQHLVGMIHSKKIIAINTDPSCNMFKVADVGVVEDYEDVIPALVEKLEALS